MENFKPKTFNASDINGGQKFNAGDGISAEAINAPIESALLMQELATTQPQYIENGGSPSVTIENGQFVFANLKGEKGEQGEQGVGIPSNMSQNANKTIIVDGSVVNGNWNATFIAQQGGKQRPISTQYTNHTGAKAEMVATSNSAKVKFVNGSTDPQSYMEIFEDKINFSKPITVQNKPVGGGGSNSSSLLYMQSAGGYNNYELYFALPKDFSNVKEIKIKYTLQYDNYNYNISTNNADVIIYNEQGFFTPTLSGLFSDSYGSTETYNVSTMWDTDNISANIFVLNFYNATDGNGGGNTTYILFEIQYK